MPKKTTVMPPAQKPLVIHDRSRFTNGFMLGSIVAVAIYAAVFAKVREGSQVPTVASGEAMPLTELAIARAEEINLAAAAYIESCGPDLADQAWREAGVAQERYQLLSSFIAFSPRNLDAYMPEEYQIVLWEDLSERAQEEKVVLLASGNLLEY